MLKLGVIESQDAYVLFDETAMWAKIIRFMGDKVCRGGVTPASLVDVLELVTTWHDLDAAGTVEIIDERADGTVYVVTVDTVNKDIKQREAYKGE